MSFSKISALAGVLALASTVSAHGHVTGLTLADGTKVGGWDLAYAYTSTPPAVAGWTTTALDNGFVAPSLYGTSDIACHLKATAGKAYATVAAGDKINIKWDTWPESHHGPVIDALAKCVGDDCTTTTAADLKFFVIAKAGLVDGSSAPGKWASDDLMANGNSWDVTIPAEIAPGKYVIRHEIIALHSAGNPDGAQSYPQCLNLEITGSGTVSPAGVPASEFYTASDPGILINIYTPLGTSYVIPGPEVYSGGAAAPAPVSSSVTAPSATTAPVASTTSAAATTPVEDEYPEITSAPSATLPPYTNGTAPTTTSTSTPVALPEEEYPSESTATVVPTPVATAVPSSPTTAPVTTPIESPSETDDSLPTGTKLSTVLAWISNFYAKNGEGAYTSETALKRRSHARHMRL